MQATHITDPDIKIGQFINVNIEEATKNSLKGKLINKKIEVIS